MSMYYGLEEPIEAVPPHTCLNSAIYEQYLFPRYNPFHSSNRQIPIQTEFDKKTERPLNKTLGRNISFIFPNQMGDSLFKSRPIPLFPTRIR